MKRKHFLAAVSVALVLAATVVTAGSQATTTPLYTIRMEQASSTMHFLPTPVTDFTYTTENTCTLHYAVVIEGTLQDVIDTNSTCSGWTCFSTCFNTCPYTCHTCPNTCQYTCQITCWAGCHTADTKPC